MMMAVVIVAFSVMVVMGMASFVVAVVVIMALPVVVMVMAMAFPVVIMVVGMAFLIVMVMIFIMIMMMVMAFFIMMVMIMALPVMVMVVMIMARSVVIMVVVIALLIMVMVVIMAFIIMVMVVIMAFLIMVMMVMVMAFPVMVMVVMVLAAAGFVMMMLMLFPDMGHHLFHHLFQGVRPLNGLQYCLSVQPGKRSGDDYRLRIMLPDQVHTFLDPFRADFIRSAQQNRPRIFDLIDKKFTEIPNIHLCLCGIHHCHRTVHLHVQISRHIFHSPKHIRQLPHTGRLDQNPLRRISLDHFLQGRTEISHQRAADTSGIHLLDLDSRFLQESAVYADLAELIFDQHRPGPVQGLLQ
jgi:hypothetical protein